MRDVTHGGTFAFWRFLMLKQSASYAQQIAKLREHGCTISNETFCEVRSCHITIPIDTVQMDI